MIITRFLMLSLRRLLRDRRGATAVIIASMVPATIGVAGLTVDVGRTLAARRALDSSTQAAALAGAYALGTSGTGAVSTAVTSWTTANPVANVTITATTPTTSCVTSATGLPACDATHHNAVTVTRTGTVSTFLLGALGRSSFELTTTSTAIKAGGNAKPLNVMFVLDATGSMGSDDSNCIVPGFNDPATTKKTTPSRFQCALYSIQSVLKVMPASLDKVGLMIFPGTSTQYSPTSRPCGTQPSSVPYGTSNIKYQIGTTLDSTYNNGGGALLTTSPMVNTVGVYVTKTEGTTLAPCVTNKGGEGRYAAEVISKAHAALPVVTGTQNVIVFLSDGDFGADADNFASSQSSLKDNQCKRAVDAAKAATTAGTKIYSVAYGASTSGCSKDTSGYTPLYKPCSTMQTIATDSSTFYTTSATCKINGSVNPVTQLPDIFKAITISLTKPRLIN
jgi:Flp pilus assembly protein TadG